MKPTQESLQRAILGVMAVLVLVMMVVLRELGNLILSIAFLLVLVVWPFWNGSLVRYKLIPYLDSLNEPKDEEGVRHKSTEDFPLWLRVLIWAFVGIFMSGLWTIIVPGIFSLPLWISRLAQMIGWKSLFAADGVWQFGWFIVFLVQYLLNFFAGFATSNDTEFYERFEYR